MMVNMLKMSSLRIRLAAVVFGAITLAITFLVPVFAFAQKEDENSALKEARLEGYTFNARAPEGGPALTYLLFIFLAVLGLAVMFKNARRTHLD
jgi:hypothetical protein